MLWGTFMPPHCKCHIILCDRNAACVQQKNMKALRLLIAKTLYTSKSGVDKAFRTTFGWAASCRTSWAIREGAPPPPSEGVQISFYVIFWSGYIGRLGGHCHRGVPFATDLIPPNLGSPNSEFGEVDTPPTPQAHL